ncbi:MAG: hypothetical protein GOV00_01825 [Candidatus Altiarchaeota archaeon]|nr:hypothetical protein [Candidatus Altiarchaeota archaeon]
MSGPAISTVINALKEGERVKIAGTLIGVNAVEGGLKMDDGTGMVDVIFKDPKMKEKIETYNSGDQLVVIGRVSEAPSKMEGEILRKIVGFDSDRYRQVLEVWKDVRSKIKESNGLS